LGKPECLVVCHARSVWTLDVSVSGRGF
jgi:hypothetical protein